MDFKVFCRRAVALCLCCVLVGGTVVRSAFAGEVAAAQIAVTGGQLAIAGLSGQKAVDYIAPKFSPIVGGCLQGCGLNPHVTGDQTRSQFVTTTVARFCGAVGYSLETFWTTIAKGCIITQQGAVQLSKEASSLISQLGSWLFTQEGEVVPEVTTTPDTDISTLGGYTFTKLMLNDAYMGISTGYSSYRRYTLHFRKWKHRSLCLAV